MCIISPGSCIVRDATGSLNDTITSQFMANCTDAACKFGFDFSTCKNGKDECKYGLHRDFQVSIMSVEKILLLRWCKNQLKTLINCH